MKLGGSSMPIVVLAAGWLLLSARAADASAVEKFNGHLSVGYAKLLIGAAPAGSFSAAGGVDYSMNRDLRVGLGVGYHLLGSRTVPRGSFVAGVDYSMFEAVLFAHWLPQHLGPVGRISAGPALLSARAELSTSGGSLAFTDLAVEKMAPGAALDVTLISRSSAPVRVGLELGSRVAFMEPENWSLVSARLAFHY